MVDFLLHEEFYGERGERSASGNALSDYDHDRVTDEDLLLLGVTTCESASNRWLVDPASRSLVTQQFEDEPTAIALPWTETRDSVVEESTSISEALMPPKFDFAEVAQADLELPLDDEVDDFAGVWAADDDPNVPWHLEVPEPDDERSSVGAAEFPGVVSGTERATQLAMAFLQVEDLVNVRNLDLLTDIILERGWSSVQAQVRALVRTGYSVEQIHLMFQITGVWLHCVQSDILAPDGWHGGHRLTWQQAARLLDVMGYDATIEEIADFLSAEQDVWSQLRRRSGELATFRDYLFRYRLSTHTQVDDGIWQSNLDPSDERSFDGTRHSLYSSDWWDEPTGICEPEFPSLLRGGYDLSRITEILGLDCGAHR